MKIVFLSRYQNQNERGVEVFTEELTKRLSKNHQIEIYVGKDADSFSKIITSKANVIVSLNGRLQALKASLGRVFVKYKLLIGGHSGIGRDDIWNIAICKPDLFVALTQKSYKWAKGFAWGSKVVNIPNGIDLDKFNPKGAILDLGLKHPIILSVGALVWYKYHNKVIEAVSKLDGVSLIIVGDGEDKDKLKKLADQKLEGRYKIMSVKYEDMPKIYRSVDLFTLPSWEREAFGIVYLEAMASNLPVVAPDDLSRREIVGNGGSLVDVNDIDLYARSLKEALHTSWGQKPREQAQKFSWDIVVKKYEELFEELRK